MKRILSLFIVFLLLINLFPYAFATETKAIDMGSFDEFSLEQIQNTFSNSLSQEKDSDTNSEQKNDDLLLYNGIDYNIPSFFCVNLKNPLTTFFSYNFDSCNLNCLYRYRLLFEKPNSVGGIGKYKMTQNSYIAVVLFDTVNFLRI